MKKRKLILGSQSPRRSELLSQLQIPFKVQPLLVSEVLPNHISLEDVCSGIARQKMGAFMVNPDLWSGQKAVVLVADTLVRIGDQHLGKPKKKSEAIFMLKLLSGEEHIVETAYQVWDSVEDKVYKNLVCTKVVFHKLTDLQIMRYVETEDPLDKAGSYGIQEAARSFVKSISGSLDGVMGLPMKEVEELFAKQGWDFE